MTAYAAFASSLERIQDQHLSDIGIVPWACPVPYFGRVLTARIATVGLNPSIREFTSPAGGELVGPERRFPTLSSLQLGSWREADATHVQAIAHACDYYFSRNPYHRWFDVLDAVLRPSGCSYYGKEPTACHLDLVPYATLIRWGDLALHQRRQLLVIGSEHLGSLLLNSAIELLILNGRSVISHFSAISDAKFHATPTKGWRLNARAQRSVPGVAYTADATQIGGVSLDTPLAIIGFNHNLQSSFGVTRQVIRSIANWVSRMALELKD